MQLTIHPNERSEIMNVLRFLVCIVLFLEPIPITTMQSSLTQAKNDQEYMMCRLERRAIDSLNLELTGTNTAMLYSQTLQDAILLLEFAALTLEKNKEFSQKGYDYNITSTLQQKMVEVRNSSYENLRSHTIKRGCDTDITTLRKIAWEGTNTWEKNFRNTILKEVLKKKINTYITPPLSDETLDNELGGIEHKIQLDLIEGFSTPISLYALYQAYNVAPSNIIKKTLTNHIFNIFKEYVKSKISAISFVTLSVGFWYASPYIQKRYPKEIRYLYELITLMIPIGN